MPARAARARAADMAVAGTRVCPSSVPMPLRQERGHAPAGRIPLCREDRGALHSTRRQHFAHVAAARAVRDVRRRRDSRVPAQAHQLMVHQSDCTQNVTALLDGTVAVDESVTTTVVVHERQEPTPFKPVGPRRPSNELRKQLSLINEHALASLSGPPTLNGLGHHHAEEEQHVVGGVPQHGASAHLAFRAVPLPAVGEEDCRQVRRPQQVHHSRPGLRD
eukprot:5676878-Lingulodinium_polyedra.AAC.1